MASIIAVTLWPCLAAERRSPKISTAIVLEQKQGYFLTAFYPGTEPDADGVLLNAGVIRLERPDLLPHHRLVLADEDQLNAIAENEAVERIIPASTDLITGQPVLSCSGALHDDGFIAHYVIARSAGWDGEGKRSADLTFTVSDVHNSGLPEEQVLQILLRAMAEWSRHAALTFSRSAFPDAQAPANIDFLFAFGAHGDGYRFDGPGRVLAHTFYPPDIVEEPLAGDVHFDAHEPWSEGGSFDLFSVALHELGHALGLGHSDRPGSVMYPYYGAALTQLQTDDISALRRIYAPPEERPLILIPEDPRPLLPDLPWSF